MDFDEVDELMDSISWSLTSEDDEDLRIEETIKILTVWDETTSHTDYEGNADYTESIITLEGIKKLKEEKAFTKELKDLVFFYSEIDPEYNTNFPEEANYVISINKLSKE